MQRRTKIVLGVVGVAAVLGAVGVVRSKAAGSADGTTKTVPVTRGEIVEKALAVGTIEPRVEISVKSQISGVVGRLYADVERAEAKLRYRSPTVAAAVARTESGFALELDEPAYGVAPGQAAVLYDGDAVVGCGLVSLS